MKVVERKELIRRIQTPIMAGITDCEIKDQTANSIHIQAVMSYSQKWNLINNKMERLGLDWFIINGTHCHLDSFLGLGAFKAVLYDLPRNQRDANR
jgi:hypothetical protein